MAYRGRFAPSPTGRVHLGTARSALLGWLRARNLGGTFVMRMEDIDGPRVVPGSAEGILADLRWLGIDWDEGPDVGGADGPYVQSECFDRYAAVLEELRQIGQVFPCTCSRKEIARIASAPHNEDGPIYPGTCRKGPTHPERDAAARFRMPEPPPRFVDRLAVPHSSDLGRGDFVVHRKDGVYAYQLACAIDDHSMRITEVLRADDLLSSTPRQIAIFEALGWHVPDYLHVPLLLGADGRRLAKRHGATAIADLRDQGRTAEQIVGRLAFGAGLIDADEPVAASELVASFHLGRIHPHAARTDDGSARRSDSPSSAA